MTPGQRWRFRRNLAIYQLSTAGWSQRMLADVFDLPRSRIATIVKEVHALGEARSDPGPESDSPGSDRGARLLNSWPRKVTPNSARPRK